MCDNHEVDELGRLKYCMHCGRENPLKENDKASFCIYCGFSLVNICTNFGECGAQLPPYAAYCPYCGTESHFLESGLAESKRKFGVDDSSDDELPF